MAPTLIYNKYQDCYVIMMDKGDEIAINADNCRVTTLRGVGDGIVSYQESSEFVEA